MSSQKRLPPDGTNSRTSGIRFRSGEYPLVDTGTARKLNRTFKSLRPSRVGLKTIEKEENTLYSCYINLVADIASAELAEPIKRRLLRLFQRHGSDTRIEELRRLTLLALLAEFLDDKIVEKVIRTEAISNLSQKDKKNFDFTFALNTTEGRQILELSGPLCELLRKTDTANRHAYLRIKEFEDLLVDAERPMVYWLTVGFINHGGKRYVFRVQFNGEQNAALLIGQGIYPFDIRLARAEAKLYEVFRSLPLQAIYIPKVFAVLGAREEGGIVMEDCTKGGNAILTPTGNKGSLLI
ncbi:hypothetical protein HYT84_02225, partial [Candidatus Micrarchaeota archaeon]|nr:hypothetical protein [Candidatus Micrarchaeota archaeon]